MRHEGDWMGSVFHWGLLVELGAIVAIVALVVWLIRRNK